MHSSEVDSESTDISPLVFFLICLTPTLREFLTTSDSYEKEFGHDEFGPVVMG